jgi:predicted DCC family thiol-disulfide oxidoreductase YuxK
MSTLTIVYDGECPFCSRYVALVRLREHFDVRMVDAREKPARARSYGLDLNEGMIADLDGKVYFGADAVWLLSTLSTRSGLINGAMARLFSSRSVSKLAYPFLRAGRNATLRLLGRKPI